MIRYIRQYPVSICIILAVYDSLHQTISGIYLHHPGGYLLVFLQATPDGHWLHPRHGQGGACVHVLRLVGHVVAGVHTRTPEDTRSLVARLDRRPALPRPV